MPARIRELDFLARRISYLAPSAAILRRRCQTDTIRPYYHKTIVSESHARKARARQGARRQDDVAAPRGDPDAGDRPT